MPNDGAVGQVARALVAAMLVVLAASCTGQPDVVAPSLAPTSEERSQDAAWSDASVSLLTFDADGDIADPRGAGAELVGEVDVLPGGVADFRGRGVVVTSDRDDLDPGTRDFVFGASIRLTRGLAASNIMQKGVFTGGQWKLSLHPADGRAELSCRVAGDEGAVHVFTPSGAIEDGGGWYDVRCRRVGDTVDVIVDGEVLASESGPIGNVASDLAYWVGGKGMDKEDPDQFLGRLDDVFLAVDRG